MEAFDPDEQNAVLAVIEGALLRHQTHQIGLNQTAAS
jgi:hypothetical protein